MSKRERMQMLDTKDNNLSIRHQAKLLDISRSNLYYRPVPTSEYDHQIMQSIDRIYTSHPYYGYRRINEQLKREYQLFVNHKKIRGLMQIMGISAIYPKPKTSRANSDHQVYPYLLNGININYPNDVWATDITYIPMHKGFLYLVAIIDWYSRYVLSWQLSNTMDASFCINALNDALKIAQPIIFNTDQGAQFTAHAFTKLLKANKIEISMNGKGRCVDNIIIERFWRSIKYENVYIYDYNTTYSAQQNISKYIDFYNNQRPHQALDYRTPSEMYYSNKR